MGSNTLTTRANGETIEASDHNEILQALRNDFVGRNSSNAPESGKQLGTSVYPWGVGYMNALVLNGTSVDPSLISSKANRVVSGRTRIGAGPSKSTSNQIDFLRADGASAAADILATATPLTVSINGVSTTFSADIALSSLSTAPATNNTADVNDTTISSDKYVGERGTEITLDAVGSEIISLSGQFIALKGASEIMFGYFEGSGSTGTLSQCYRGFFFDDAGDPIVREGISNNDTLTLLKVGWVFIQSSGTTEVSYTTPSYGFASPGSPAAGDYWLDQTNQVWKRYSGTEWVSIERTLLGLVVMDSTNCVASRSLDPYVSYSSTNNLALELASVTELQTTRSVGELAVYGSELDFANGRIVWDITADLETGVTEAASTTYYAYLDEYGQPVLSDERPYERLDLLGYYHPYHAWRFVGESYNNASSNLTEPYQDGGPYHMRAYLSAGQTIATGTATTLQFDSTSFSTMGSDLVDSGANTGRIIPKRKGKYRVSAVASIASITDSATFLVYLYKNGALYGVLFEDTGSTTFAMSGGGTDIVEVDGVADYLEIRAQHNVGSNQTIQGGATESRVIIEKVD